MTKMTRFGMRILCGAFVAALSLGLGHPTHAEDETQWVRQLGTPMDDNATGVATDGDGNVYTAGLTNGSLGGPHEGGLYDAWVATYSAAGALRWTRQLGTSDDVELGAVTTGVATDGYGNVYTAGYTDGSLGGPHQGGYYNAWLVKYSTAGAFRWKRQLGTSAGEAANGVATDGNGNVYIAGWTDGDALVAKYSPAGALRWVRRLEGATANGVATDGDGNVYIAGWIGSDALVAKYSPTGALRWVRRLEGATANGVATDGDGNVYIAGSTGPYQGEDAVLAKYSAAGAFRWKRQLRTAKADDAQEVATDGDGNVYVAGRMGCCVGAALGADAWLAKYSAMGVLRWKRQLKTSDGGLLLAWRPMATATSTSPEQPTARSGDPAKAIMMRG